MPHNVISILQASENKLQSDGTALVTHCCFSPPGPSFGDCGLQVSTFHNLCEWCHEQRKLHKRGMRRCCWVNVHSTFRRTMCRRWCDTRDKKYNDEIDKRHSCGAAERYFNLPHGPGICGNDYCHSWKTYTKVFITQGENSTGDAAHSRMWRLTMCCPCDQKWQASRWCDRKWQTSLAAWRYFNFNVSCTLCHCCV